MEKFHFSGRLLNCPEGVYFPAEDSFLLAGSVRAEKGCLALDMGCGSGIQSANMLLKGSARVIAADVDEKALEAAKSNCAIIGAASRLEARKSDLFQNVPEKFGLIVFNPPYIATRGTKYADLDGGEKGREVLDRFLAEMPRHLDAGGECYFLQTDANGLSETEEKLKETGFGFEAVARKRVFFEELVVYRCWKK